MTSVTCKNFLFRSRFPCILLDAKNRTLCIGDKGCCKQNLGCVHIYIIPPMGKFENSVQFILYAS